MGKKRRGGGKKMREQGKKEGLPPLEWRSGYAPDLYPCYATAMGQIITFAVLHIRRE